ncbi:phage-related protein/uncharacterized protein YqgV (UPF0045/DUF77 family) [Micromonospora sp. A200]|uniref:hypothetical protein n=1 Tax=Micromonospora sp. A200 TaxID=2940568 RepID=UPI002472F4AA|nr:hypothetical protein [Micromonospora sp. A200]MDH6462054.1 phage-related protein/uncharacterized protein YqgV (UPF0045/DUF77 family) [Micromonospora sp. A200]
MAQAGTVIGRVAVKVMPDTRHFREDAKRQLERIERGLQIEAKIVAKVDKAQVKQQVEQMNQAAKAAAKDITIHVNMDNQDSVLSGIKKLQAELDKLGSKTKTFKVGLNADELNAKIAELNDRLDEIRKITLSVDLADRGSLQKSIAQMEAELAKLKEVEIPVGLNEEALTAKIAEFQERLKDIPIELSVDLGDKGSLQRAIAQMEAELSKIREVKIPVGVSEDELVAKIAEFQDRIKSMPLKMSVDLTDKGSLQRAIAQMESQLSKIREIEIPVDLDEKSLVAKIAEFRAKIKRDPIELSVDLGNRGSLKKALDQMEAELAKLKEITVPVGLDERSLTAKIEEYRAKLKGMSVEIDVKPGSDASVKKAIAQIEEMIEELQPTAKVTVKPDLNSLLKAKAELESQLQAKAIVKAEMDKAAAKIVRDRIEKALADIPVSTKMDKAKVAATMREIESLLDKMEDLKAKITPEIDARAKAQVEREMADLQDKINGLKATIKPEVFGAPAAAMLAWLARSRIVNFIPTVDPAAMAATIAGLSGIRVVTDLFQKFFDTMLNFDKLAPKIGAVTTAVLGLAGAALASISNITALGVSLAQLAPAALLLPGIFAGMAIGIGTAWVALKDFNTVLPGVKQQLSELADRMSSNFWGAAKKPISELIDTLLPKFGAGLEMVSTTMGGFFGKLSDSLKVALGGDVLTGMFANLNKSIEIAGGATDGLANIIKILGQVGSEYLPRLAQWFVDITNKFSKFLTDAKADGSLKAWIDNAIAGIGDLWTILTSVFKIFGSIGEAAQAAGGSTLASMADSLSAVAKAAESPAFQGQLTDTFAAAHAMFDMIANTSGPAVENMFSTLAGTLQTVLPAVGVIIGTLTKSLANMFSDPALQTGIITLVEGVKQGIGGLAPAIESLGPVFGGLATLAGIVVENLGPLISTILPPLAGLFTALLPSINELARVLGDVLLSAFQDIMPALQPVMDAVKEFAPVLVDGLAPILQLVGELFSRLVTAIAPLVTTFMGMYQNIIPPLLEILRKIIEENMDPLIEAVQKLVAALQPVIAAIGVVVGWLLTFLGPVIVWVAGIIIDVLIMAIDGIARIFESVVGIVMGIWNTFAGLFTGDWGRMWDGIKQIFSSLWNGLVGILEVFIAWIGGTAIKGLFKTVGAGWTAGWNAVKKFFTDFVGWIKSFAQKSFDEWVALISNALKAVINFFRNMGKAIREAVSSAWKAVVKFFDDGLKGAKDKTMNGLNKVKEFFVDMGKSIAKTVREKFNEVVKIMTEVFRNPGEILKEIGKKIIDGLIAGLRAGFDLVKGTLSSLTEWIKDWKGPESYDRVLLTPAGKLIIDGLIKGMESRYDSVRRSLRGLTGDIAGTEFGIPGISSGALSAGISAAISGAAGGDEDRVTKVLNYYAAAGSSLGSEEDLFKAAGRARMVGW